MVQLEAEQIARLLEQRAVEQPSGGAWVPRAPALERSQQPLLAQAAPMCDERCLRGREARLRVGIESRARERLVSEPTQAQRGHELGVLGQRALDASCGVHVVGDEPVHGVRRAARQHVRSRS